MRYFVEFLRALIVSPEILCTLIILVLAKYEPTLMAAVGDKVKSDQEIWKFLPAIPFAVLAWALPQSKEILFPSKSSNRLLLDWPDYWKLKTRVIVSLLLILICIVASLAIYFFKTEASALVIGSIFGISTIVSVSVACSLWLAGVTVRQMMEE